MNKISVAIPTYYSTRFIGQTMNSLKHFSIIDEIVICDDSEDDKEFKNLDRVVKSELANSEIKLTIKKNDKNLGGFKNKYSCIEKTTNNHVYQIDSDNIANPKTLKYIAGLDLINLDKAILHLPSKIFLFQEKKYERFFKLSNNVTYLKNTKIFNADDIKKALINNEKFVINRNIGWLLNTGNPFFYKNSYLKFLKPGLRESENNLAACSIALVYFWLKSGHPISVSNFLSHYHRLRDDSYFVSRGDIAVKSINNFKERFKKL